MARQVVLTLLALALCIQSIAAFQFTWGKNPKYNELCPGTGFSSVPMPEDECDTRSYIMCSFGQAVATNRCPHKMRFSPTNRWCDMAQNVPVPSNCENTEPETPTTCAEGAQYMEVEGNCKKYIWCLPNGAKVEMNCQDKAYFVPEKQRCMFTTVPYVYEIPADVLSRCSVSDPY